MKKDKDLQRTKAFLASMKLHAAGWQVGTTNQEHAGASSVVLYLYDQPTGWTWLCSVPQETFTATSTEAHNTPALTESIRGGLGKLIQSCADTGSAPALEDLDWESQLALTATAYAGTTKTWEIMKKMSEGGHFIVLNYRKTGKIEGMLRPVAMPGNDGFIPADEFQDLVKQVMAGDKARHPEWFR
ncbi:hypothetical protein LC612_31825 [Nostoc sp. CHAB 5834]|nr:hypothetical protein [Nostoc sp. CHAB 5834]